ncbi:MULTISPECIES: sugar phosphate nucleotidyltransferase [Bradyrhizobium]
MDKRIIPLIMCGGAGTQLWPASREVRPKQFPCTNLSQLL